MDLSRDMNCALFIGPISATWNAEGVAWSPDVADDMTRRVVHLMREALAMATEFGVLGTFDTVDEDEDEEVGGDG